MRSVLVLMVFCCASLVGIGQGTAMPPFSFAPQSTDFADANRSFRETGSFTQTDTLSDQVILNTLVGILKANPQLVIALVGHTAADEPEVLGEQRANRVRDALLEEGIAPERLETENAANSAPKISQEVLIQLPTPLEREIAQQRNRRVEVRVIRADHQ